jgi:type IX secretion system PorP/SprF family membrane protein
MSMKYKYLTFLLLAISPGIKSSGQQLPLLSQYSMDMYQINPAFAGHSGYTNITLSAHEQWLGMAHSPKTHTLSFQARLYEQSYIRKENPVKKKWRRPFKGGRIGVGATVYNDRSGLFSRTGFQLTYAYHIPFQFSQLSFGLSANAFQFKFDMDKLDLADEGDPFLVDYDGSLFIPDANFGVAYSARNYTLGFSIDNLFQSSLKLGKDGNTNYQIFRHYYLTGSYSFSINKNLALEPAVLIRTTNGFNSFQADANLTLRYRNDYWGGISYRTIDALILMGGLNYNQFYFGYAFNYSMSRIRSHNYGTHEIIVGMQIGDRARRYRWLNEM